MLVSSHDEEVEKYLLLVVLKKKKKTFFDLYISRVFAAVLQVHNAEQQGGLLREKKWRSDLCLVLPCNSLNVCEISLYKDFTLHMKS